MEEIKIKALIDAADSAKTIQELKKALKDLKSAAVEAGEGSEAFNRITAAAGQVSDRVGDLNAQVNALGDDLGKLRGVTQIAQGIAGGFATAQGALALFGSENAALEESLLKVNGAMSMLNGIMAIGEVLQKQSAASLLAQNVLRSVTVGLVGKETVAKAQLAVANGTATATQRALNAAMTANPAGIILVTITALIGAYYLFSDSTDTATQAQKNLASALDFTNQMMEYQDEVARRTEKAQRDLAESRGADTNELLKMDKEASKNQEKRDKERLANLKKSIDAQRKLRTKAILDGEDEDADAAKQKIDTYQKEVDALELNFTYLTNMGNKYQIERQIIDNKVTQNNKKAAEKRTKDSKKELDKAKTDYENFVFDIKKLNEVIIEQDIALGETLLSTWEDTYDKKLYSILLAQEKEIAGVSKIYDDFYTSQQEKFLKSAEWMQIEADKKKNKIVITPEIKDEAFKKWVASQPAIYAQLQVAYENIELQKTAITNKYSSLRRQLIDEEVKASAKLFKDSAKSVLTGDEFTRYLDFVKLNSEELRKQGLKDVEHAVNEVQAQLNRLKGIKEADEVTILGKSIKGDAEKAAKLAEAITMVSNNLNTLKERQKQIAALGPQALQNVEKTLAYQEELLKEKENAAVRDEKDIALQQERVDELKKQRNELMKKPVGDDGLKEYIKLLNLVGVEYENTMSIMSMSSQVSDSGVATITKTTHQVGKVIIDGFENDAKLVSQAVDKNINGIYAWSDKSSSALERVFNLQRKLTKDNIGENIASNKLLTTLYQDKSSGIIKEEDNINSQLPALLDERIKLYSKAQADETAEMKKVREERLAELQKLQGREFQVTPRAGKNDIGLEELTKNIPQLTQQMTTALEDRYKALTDIEQRYYDQQLYNLFKQRDSEAITEEEYNKKLEELKKNHEENILAMDVVYGKKGQEAFVALQQERKDLVKAEHQKEKERKMKNLQELLDIEKMARQLFMQYLEQSYAKEDRLSEERYNNRIAQIDDEQKAYEDSIANRTASEQQQQDIQAEFDLKKEEAEKQRRMEQNAIAAQAFEAQKINSLAEIAIQYAVAIAKDWGTLGPFGAPMAAFHLIEAGLAAALVASQEFVPAFAKGGLVTGPGGPKDDMIDAKLSNGEAVINAKSTSMYAPILSAINEAGGGAPIPHLRKGGLIMPQPSPQNVNVVNSAPAVVGLDNRTMEVLDGILNNQQVSISENTITNTQNKVAKVERRTKF